MSRSDSLIELEKLAKAQLHQNPELTQKQQYLFNYYCHTETLDRFLRARDNDIDKALRMWGQYVDWHLQYRPDLLRYKDIQQCIQKSDICYILGKDYQNRTIVYVNSGKTHLIDQNDLTNLMRYVLELATQQAEQYGQESIVVIFDNKLFSSSLLNSETIEKGKFALNWFQKYFPERVNQIILLNCTYFLKLVLKMFKALMSAKTIEKITIIEDLNELSGQMDINLIPKDPKNLVASQFWEQYSNVQNNLQLNKKYSGNNQQFNNEIQELQNENIIHQQNEDTIYHSLENNSEQFNQYQNSNNNISLFGNNQQKKAAHTFNSFEDHKIYENQNIQFDGCCQTCNIF